MRITFRPGLVVRDALRVAYAQVLFLIEQVACQFNPYASYGLSNQLGWLSLPGRHLVSGYLRVPPVCPLALSSRLGRLALNRYGMSDHLP